MLSSLSSKLLRSNTLPRAASLLLSHNSSLRFFSTDAAPEQPTEEAAAPAKNEDNPSEEELQNAREEWGFKFDDECFKFEKEWKTIAEAVERE